MAKYVLTKKAVSDLSNIWNYTFDNWSEEQANRYYQMLIEHIKLIADNPDIGKKYDVVRNELRGLIAEKHIIFYKKSSLSDVSIEIIRILHGRVNLKNRL